MFKEPIINSFGVSDEATSSPFPPLTVSEPQTFSSVIVCHSYHLGAFSLLSEFTRGKAFLHVMPHTKVVLFAAKVGNHAADRTYTISEACVCMSLAKYENKTVFVSDK